MIILKKLTAVILLCSWASLSFGFDDPVDEKTISQIDSVNLETRQIIINDWVYELALDLKVHGPNGLETDFALQEEKIITYEINPASAERDVQTITDIWLEPK